VADHLGAASWASASSLPVGGFSTSTYRGHFDRLNPIDLQIRDTGLINGVIIVKLIQSCCGVARNAKQLARDGEQVFGVGS
jgi:hypothetical protein